MTTHAIKQLFTVADYYKLVDVGILHPTDKVELIKGEIYKMSPINSKHASVVNILSRLLMSGLGDNVIVTVQNPISIDEFTEPEPDILVAHYQDDFYAKNHPSPADTYVLIEVADSSLNYDRKVKVPLYAEAGIREYWIINLKNDTVEVYTSPFKNTYQNKNTYHKGEIVTAKEIDFSIGVSKLFK